MPIRLKPPAGWGKPSDGDGWNRLSLGAHIGPEPTQCALQPTTYRHYVESSDTRRAQWGGYRRCVQPDGPDPCGGCPVLTRTTHMDAFGNRVLVRLNPAHPHRAYLMNRPEDGWASNAQRWNWTDLSRLDGWTVGETYHDEHGDGFWLVRSARTTTSEES